MGYDIRTAILGLAVGNLIFGLILLLFQFGGKESQRIPYLAAGKLLQGAGWLILVNSGALPDWLRLTVGNSVLIIGFAFDTWTMYWISQQPVSRTMWATSAAAVVLICILIAPLPAATRVAVASFTVMFFYALGGRVMLSRADGNVWLRRYVGWSMWVMVAVLSVRGVWATLAPENFTLLEANTIQLVMYAVLYCLMLTVGFGLLLLAINLTGRDLRAREARLRSYFELPIAGFAITAPDKGWLEVSDGLCAMLGYSAQELAGLTWADLTYPADLAADEAQFRRVVAREIDTYALEKRYIRKDGDVVWAALSAGCVRKSDGSVDYFVALLQDITAHKKAEEALQTAEARFRTLIEQAPVAIGLSRDGLGVYANSRFLQMFGLASLADVVGRPATDSLALPCRAASQERARLRSLGLPVPTEYETTGLRSDGTEFPMAVAVARVQLMDGMASVNFITDITERKRTEDALRQSEAQYRLLAENVVDVVWVLNTVGQFTYVSPSVAALRGYTPEEVMQQSPEEAVCPGSLAALQAGMEQAFHTIHTGERRPPALFQIEQPCKDGSTVWTEVIGRVMYDELQRPVGVVGVSRDITARRQAEEALRISEARHRLIAENTRDVIWVMGIDGAIVYTSPSRAYACRGADAAV